MSDTHLFQVAVGDEVVWEATFPDGSAHNFPAEYLARPPEPAEGEPFPPGHILVIDGEVVGVQVCRAESAFNAELVAYDDALMLAGDPDAVARFKAAWKDQPGGAAAAHQRLLERNGIRP